MTIIFYAFVLAGGFCLSAITQVQNLRQANSFLFLKEKSSGQMTAYIKSYEELNKKFTELLGKSIMISNPQVAAQLEKALFKLIMKNNFKL